MLSNYFKLAGSSERESYVPLFIWSSESIKQGGVVDVEQVDLTPTISFLLNIGIAAKSVGVLMDDHFLDDLEEVVRRVELNAAQLYQLALSNKPLFSGEQFGLFESIKL
jgi:hypothetical protein